MFNNMFDGLKKAKDFKGYLHYKTIFCNKVALDVINEFFCLKKKQCFVLEISRFLCFGKMHRFQNL